jgi:hypothetical protein
MKKFRILTLLLLAGPALPAQPTITLDTPRTAGGVETACQSIVLKPVTPVGAVSIESVHRYK